MGLVSPATGNKSGRSASTVMAVALCVGAENIWTRLPRDLDPVISMCTAVDSSDGAGRIGPAQPDAVRFR